MTAVPAHELTRVVICKEFGCENECRTPLIERGPYANLCDDHYERMREKMSSAQRRNGGPLPRLAEAATLATANDLAPRNGHVSSLKEAAQACVQPAGDLDKALLRKSAADSEAQRAKGALAEALRALQVAVQDVSA